MTAIFQDADVSPLNEDHERALCHFDSLCADLDFQEEWGILDLGPMRFVKRAEMKREFMYLYIALWRLALIRSFPHNHNDIFHAYMQRSGKDSSKADTGGILYYVEMLRTKGDTDFSGTASHILTLCNIKSKDSKAASLRLALHLRRMFLYFFHNLV